MQQNFIGFVIKIDGMVSSATLFQHTSWLPLPGGYDLAKDQAFD